MTNLPRARIYDPGLYTELTLPQTSYWTTAVGARVDFVNTDARMSEVNIRRNNAVRQSNLDPDRFSQNDVLYAFYLLNDVQLTSHWTTRFGFGHAQRPPTLTERYADGVFLGIIQSGFNRFIGTPELDKERAWQIDLGLEAEYAWWRGRVSGFHSWVLDYITFTSLNVTLEGARLLRTLNTERATLSGVDLYAEVDVAPRLTAFGSLAYVEGRDQEINQPLANISPLEGRTGLRLHDACGGRNWAVEMVARFVNDQDRIGGVRIGTIPPYSVGPFELPTPGFTTVAMRGYYVFNDNFNIVGGVDNLFDNNYLEHLNLRLPPDPGLGFPDPTNVYSPGITPYLGVEWTH
jgi:iron complex outermembrane receptor protein